MKRNNIENIVCIKIPENTYSSIELLIKTCLTELSDLLMELNMKYYINAGKTETAKYS